MLIDKSVQTDLGFNEAVEKDRKTKKYEQTVTDVKVESINGNETVLMDDSAVPNMEVEDITDAKVEQNHDDATESRNETTCGKVIDNNEMETEELPPNDRRIDDQDMALNKLHNEQRELLQRVRDEVTTLLHMTQGVLREVDTNFSGKLRKITRKPLLDLLPGIRQTKKTIELFKKSDPFPKESYDLVHEDINKIFRKVLEIRRSF